MIRYILVRKRGKNEVEYWGLDLEGGRGGFPVGWQSERENARLLDDEAAALESVANPKPPMFLSQAGWVYSCERVTV